MEIAILPQTVTDSPLLGLLGSKPCSCGPAVATAPRQPTSVRVLKALERIDTGTATIADVVNAVKAALQ
jgi:hypothetical protein